MFTEFNRIYALEIDLKNLETIFNSKALYANTDLNTSAMLIKLSLGETPLDVTDKIVTAYIKTAKDQIVTMQRCEILEANEGVIGLDFKSSALKTGTNTFFLEIKSDNEEIINSPLITYKVVELFDVTGGSDGENNVTILSQIITEIDILKTSVEGLESEIAILRKSIEDLQNIDMVGKEVQLQKSEEYIQWKYADEEEWRNLIALEELKVKGVYVGSKDTAPSTADIIIDNSDEGLLFEEVVPNIQIGEVTTLEPGTKATVSRRGTKENPIFDFGIPKGDNGSNGADGATPNMAEFEKKINEQYNDIINKNNTFKEEIVNENTAFKEEMNINFGSAKTDYFGEEHLNVVDRLNSDFDNVHQRINDSSYLAYEGRNITADNSYYGYVKKMSVKGRTLQNVLLNVSSIGNGIIEDNNSFIIPYNVPTFAGVTYDLLGKINTTYTIIINILELFDGGTGHKIEINDGTNAYINNLKLGINKFTITTNGSMPGNPYLKICKISSATGGNFTYDNLTVLEGDYTNTPLDELPFGEGIYSVGESEVTEDGKYPISVKSCGKNLFDVEKFKEISNHTSTTNVVTYTRAFPIKLKPNTAYLISTEYDTVTNYLGVINGNGERVNPTTGSKFRKVNTTTDGMLYMAIQNITEDKLKVFLTEVTNIQLEEIATPQTTPTPYEPYKESIQELQLTEPLRSLPNGVCDEILEDGTEVRRVGKIVLNGSESSWRNGVHINDDFIDVRLNLNKLVGVNTKNGVCDTLPYANYLNTWIGVNTGISVYNHATVTEVIASIPKTKVIDLQSWKDWLSQNPTTLYYELIEPIITKHNLNINLKTFEKTTHITSDNYLQPKLSCKVPSNVQATIMNLKEENEELNNTISLMSLENEEIKTVNETQDILIDTTMMATDEMFTMLEPILEMLPQTTNLEREVKNSMVDLYVAMVMRGLKTIEQVPARYREEAREILAQLEK